MNQLKVTGLADIEAYEQTPLTERLTAHNTYDLLRQGAAVDPEATAITFFPSGADWDRPQIISYAELLASVTQTANLLTDLGLGSDQVATYLLPNLPQTHYVLWGGEAAGVVNPVNWLLEPATIADICRAAKTKILVALAEEAGTDIWAKALAVRKAVPSIETIIRVGGPSDEADGIIGLEEALPKYQGERLDSGREISPDDRASMYHTGGTTGTPKLAPHTHFNEAAMALMAAEPLRMSPQTTALCGLPLFHVNGTTVTGSAPFSVGAKVILAGLGGYRDPEVMKNFYRIIERYRVTMFSAVPTILSVLLDIPKGQADISSLEFLVCGAAPLSVELFNRFEEFSGLKILEGYGLTEGTCVTSVNPRFGQRKIGSVGIRLPYHGLKVGLVDDQGALIREAAPNEIGSVLIGGANVFDGYLDPAHNQGIWAEPGWFNTGDLGRRDEDGYLWLTGRRKELIIRGGHNIDPALIEDPLYRLDGVALAAAVPWPDPHAGEVPAVYVQLQEGSELTEADIAAYLAEAIGERAAVPKRVIVIDQLPLTAVGKLFKPALKWRAVSAAYREALGDLDGLAESIDLTVGEDKIHGTLAGIAIKPAPGASYDDAAAKAVDRLAPYSIRYKLQPAD